MQKILQAISDIRRSKRATFGPVLEAKDDRALAQAHFWYHDHHMLRHLWANETEFAPNAWRSNQPDPARIDGYAKRGIKTILNLRGTANRSHYLFEKEACETHRIVLVSMALSAKKAAPRAEYLALLDHFETIEKPVLIHCKSGADRTGIAAVFYLLHIEQMPLDVARKQLGLKYLHLRWFKTGILDDILDAYADDLAQHGPIALRDWLTSYYDPEAITAAFRQPR